MRIAFEAQRELRLEATRGALEPGVWPRGGGDGVPPAGLATPMDVLMTCFYSAVRPAARHQPGVLSEVGSQNPAKEAAVMPDRGVCGVSPCCQGPAQVVVTG